MNIGREITRLKAMTVSQLLQRYADLFGEETRSRHKEYLVKRIAWRMQSAKEGTLSERARRRAEELANDADIRMYAPKNHAFNVAPERTRILEANITQGREVLMPGTVLTRKYKDRMIIVTVLPNGFEYDGKVYRSLSAVARAVTGTHWNGYHFFNLRKNGKANA